MFPSWDSVEELEKWSKTADTIGHWWPIGFSIVILVVVTIWTTFNRQVSARLADLKALAAAEESLWIISDEEIDALVPALRGFSEKLGPGFKVLVAAAPSQRKSFKVSKGLLQCLQEGRINSWPIESVESISHHGVLLYALQVSPRISSFRQAAMAGGLDFKLVVSEHPNNAVSEEVRRLYSGAAGRTDVVFEYVVISVGQL
jgi:hypothetical protein